jgi:hypothetical protein
MTSRLGTGKSLTFFYSVAAAKFSKETLKTVHKHMTIYTVYNFFKKALFSPLYL